MIGLTIIWVGEVNQYWGEGRGGEGGGEVGEGGELIIIGNKYWNIGVNKYRGGGGGDKCWDELIFGAD
jgi:hypothetical protein